MGARVLTERNAFAMRSPVGWAVLGLLIERTGYGYDLIQRFERTYGDALELSSPAQIYKALDALEQRSLIEKLLPPSPPDLEAPPEGAGVDPQRQPKPRYRATEEGLRSYQDWLIAQVSEKRQRSHLFARELAVLHPRAALAVLDRYEQECLREQTTAASDPSLAGASPIAGRLIEEEARLATGQELKWIAYARRELKRD